MHTEQKLQGWSVCNFYCVVQSYWFPHLFWCLPLEYVFLQVWIVSGMATWLAPIFLRWAQQSVMSAGLSRHPAAGGTVFRMLKLSLLAALHQQVLLWPILLRHASGRTSPIPGLYLHVKSKAAIATEGNAISIDFWVLIFYHSLSEVLNLKEY